jgi:hypothetical protein
MTTKRFFRKLHPDLWLALLFGCPSVSTAAPLVPQLALCLPDAYTRPAWEGIPKDTKGYGNDPSRQGKFYLKFVYSVDDTSFPPNMTEEERSQAIQNAKDQTSRVEICWIDKTGQISCPAQSGQNQWLIFDKDIKPNHGPPNALAPGIPDVSYIKRSLTEVTSSDMRISEVANKTSKLQTFLDLSFDWDSPANEGKILFLVVNGKTPQSLADIQQELTLGGYCPTPTRIAKASDKPAGVFSTATISAAGTTTPEDIHFVAYGIPHDFPLPPGWPLGDVCAPSKGNKTGYLNVNPCIHRDTTRLGLDLLVGVDTWQRDVFQALFDDNLTKKIPTWQNGVGYPGSTCTEGKTCPTRVLWTPFRGGAGYSWGGKHTTQLGVLHNPVKPMSVMMGAHLRNSNHEYFHGLQETHAAVTGKAVFFNHPDISESTATTAEVSTCLVNYPPNSNVEKFDPEKCITGRTMYGFYDYGGLLSGNEYLAFPESPTTSYPGVLFFRYVTSQFAYNSGTKSHPSGPPSASRVRFDLQTGKELDLHERRPDEGLDLLGYLFQSFAGQGNTVCDGLLPPGAGVDQHLDCVFKSYLGVCPPFLAEGKEAGSTCPGCLPGVLSTPRKSREFGRSFPLRPLPRPQRPDPPKNGGQTLIWARVTTRCSWISTPCWRSRITQRATRAGKFPGSEITMLEPPARSSRKLPSFPPRCVARNLWSSRPRRSDRDSR